MTIYYDNASSVQVELGCDCCEVNGELVPDKHNWTVGGITYGRNHLKMYKNNHNSVVRVLSRKYCSQTKT